MIRLAVAVSHPIQYFSPLFQQLAMLPELDLKVFYSCRHGLSPYEDKLFDTTIAWDIPLLEGYESEFLPIHHQPDRLSFLAVDNAQAPAVVAKFRPSVIVVFGYAHRTMWRLARWAHRSEIPVVLISDSSSGVIHSTPRFLVKEGLVREFYRHVDGAIYVSDRNYYYHRHFGLPTKRLYRGILAIDNARFSLLGNRRDRVRREVRDRLGIPAEDFVIILAAKLAPGKRQADLLAACAAVSKVQNKNVWALLVGDGPDRPLLESTIAKQGIAAIVTGFVNQVAMPAHYAAMDAVALCSDDEPHGLALAEAVALGLPAVVSDRVGAVGSLGPAQPGRNTIVYRCGDIGELVDSIRLLVSDEALHGELSRQSEAISKELDIGKAAKDVAYAAACVAATGVRA